MTAQPGLCQTLSETPKTGFLRTRLIYIYTICMKDINRANDLKEFAKRHALRADTYYHIYKQYKTTKIENVP